MYENLSILRLSSALAGHAAQRQSLTARNIANADTPGYRRKTVSFDTEYQNGSAIGRVETGDVHLDQSNLERVYDPAHPMADETGHFQGSNVNLLIEIADAREAQRSYEANLKMFEQSKQMSSNLLSLLQK